MGKLYVIGTMDTKGEELRYATAMAQAAGADTILVDVSTQQATADVDVPAQLVAAFHPEGAEAVFSMTDRASAVAAMAKALCNFLSSRHDLGGVLGLGGSGNTALVTEAMRCLPVGIPKLMLSTIASGNNAPYVGSSDIAMMYSVVDIAGLNAISRRVIANAAHAAAGMVANAVSIPESVRPVLGMTMFGVTTPCVSRVRALLEADYDVLVFHATGVGGQSMEQLAESGFFAGLLDLTTTEVADFLVGGIFPAGEDRFGSVVRTKVPYVGSLGALDMVNFGARETVPPAFQSRTLHMHNAQVTLMRTTAEENAAIGAFIVERLNRMLGPVCFLLPLGGLSAIDRPGQPFHDPEADRVLFDTIRKGWKPAKNRRLVEVNANINDSVFADAVVAALEEVIN